MQGNHLSPRRPEVDSQRYRHRALPNLRRPLSPAGALRPQARGKAEPGSDIDRVLLLQESSGASERHRYSRAVAELSLRHNTVISLVPMAVDEFRSGRTPFLLNVRREGVPL
jgi:hypothetical protein